MSNKFINKLKSAHPSWKSVAILSMLAFILLFLFELGFSYLSLWGYFVYFLFSLIPIGIFCIWKPSQFKFYIVLAYFTAIMALYPFMWSSRKAFLKDLNIIEVGMTKAEVQKIMGKYIVGTGWPTFNVKRNDIDSLTEANIETTGELELKDSITYRHSNDGRFDSDWGVVQFSKDKVINVEFLPD